MNKAAFLDRDGVINRKAPIGQYVTSWEEMQMLPDVAQAISLFNRAGYLVIVVTNQRSVAKRLITVSELEGIHQRMCDELARAGATVHGVYYCPHELEPACSCRKPQPGMLLRAAEAHNIDLSASWMIGDSDRDVEAGKSAGCQTIRLVESAEADNGKADAVASSLLEATLTILQRDGGLAHQAASGAAQDSTRIS
jgi:D-glycero-D-manno-heptose 1,7-bisphosphate phosphatase